MSRPEEEEEEEEEESRCQAHTSHVAVVDLPPLPPSLHPSILHPSCFSPLCQDVGSVSRRSVKHSHEPAFPPPLTLSAKRSHEARVHLQCPTQTDTFLKVQEQVAQKRSPLCSRKVGTTQNLCLHKRPDSKCWPSHLSGKQTLSQPLQQHLALTYISLCCVPLREMHTSPESPQQRQSKTQLYLHTPSVKCEH